MTVAALPAPGPDPLYNLVGQRLGRKGRDTRGRIIAATERLLADPDEPTITLSEVARQASLAMTTLYLYFNDLTELLIAVLEPVTAQAQAAFLARLARRWPDAALAAECLGFVEAYQAFWARNRRLLHLRNHYADMGDERLYRHRLEAAYPAIALLARQMQRDPQAAAGEPDGMASMLLTAIERMATVTTRGDLPMLPGVTGPPRTRLLVEAAARLLELAIRDARGAPPA